MSTATRVPLQHAEGLAENLCGLLRPACLQLIIAGSIRRRRDTIGDIELCAEPIIGRELNLFGEPVGPQVDLLEDRVGHLCVQQVLALRVDVNGRERYGPRYKALSYQGLNVDLFCTDAERWGLILAIRTGPAAWSKRLVTTRRNGGLLPDFLQVKDGLRRRDSGALVPVPTEEELFRILGLAFVPPEQRQ